MSVKRYDVMSYSLDVDGNSGPFVKYDDYAALEARCAALAAENEGLKAAHADAIGSITKTINRGLVVFSDTPIKFSVETTATDDSLAEVRAQGVEMFAAHKRERQQALRSRSMRMSEEAAGMAADAEGFASQIRKGVQP